MPDQFSTSQVIRFATFEVDLQAQELRKAGLRLKLSGQPFKVLAILLEQPGLVVTREELQKRLWPDTFVDVDHNLNTAINKIREALADSSENPRFVETLPRRGYRFIAPLNGSIVPDAPTATPSTQVEVRARESFANQSWHRSYLLVALFATVLVTFVAALLYKSYKPTSPAQRALTRLTFDEGLQIGATWSPDGRFIAFSSDRGGKFDIWVQQVDGGEAVQVTKGPSNNWQPDWSPDGKYIAYRSELGDGGLYVVPALGGTGLERRIAPFGHYPRWSPDGTQILFRSKFALLDERDKIYVVRLDGSPPTPILGNFAIQNHVTPISVVWHPDGRRVTLWGDWSVGNNPISEFWTVSMDGSSATKSEESAAVKAEFSKMMSTESEGPASLENLGNPRFAWAPSGNAIYCSIALRGVRNLWKLIVDPQTLEITGMERLTTGPGPDGEVALSPDGKRAAFTAKTEHTRIWLLPFNATHGEILGPGKPVTPTAISAVEHILSLDGTKLAFIGERAGKKELWEESPIDGRESPVIVDGYIHTYPIWSPDGTQLVDSRIEPAKDSWQVMIRSAADRIEQPVTDVLTATQGINRAILVYDWSRDGKQLLISRRSDETHRMEVWQMPISAGPKAETASRKITVDPRYDLWQPHLSPNGHWIVFQAVAEDPATAESALYVVPAAGGTWTRVTDGKHWDDKPNWSPDGKTIYFVSGRGGGFYNVWGIRFDPSSGKPVGQSFQVSKFENPGLMVPRQISPVALSITEDKMALTLGDSSGSIWILDNADR